MQLYYKSYTSSFIDVGKEGFTLPQEAVFTFCYLGGKLKVSSKTELVSKSQEETSVKIIGFCCDAYGELDRNEIADYILSHSSSNVSTIFNACNRLAGHYVIFFKNNNNEYVWGDATCSIQEEYLQVVLYQQFAC